MDLEPGQRQWRSAVAARAGLPAQELAGIATLAPELGALDRPRARELGELGLSARAISLLTQPDEARIANDLAWLTRANASLLASIDERYPQLLRESPDAPPGAS